MKLEEQIMSLQREIPTIKYGLWQECLLKVYSSLVDAYAKDCDVPKLDRMLCWKSDYLRGGQK